MEKKNCKNYNLFYFLENIILKILPEFNNKITNRVAIYYAQGYSKKKLFVTVNGFDDQSIRYYYIF